jgi:nitrate/nitrite transporter NarK
MYMILKYFFGTILIIFTIFNLAFCGDWDEGSMQGSCAIQMMDPLYNAFMGVLLLAGFTGMIWLPFLILIQLLVSKYSKKKVQSDPTQNDSVVSAPADKALKTILRNPTKYWWLYLILLNFGLSYLRDLFF